MDNKEHGRIVATKGLVDAFRRSNDGVSKFFDDMPKLVKSAYRDILEVSAMKFNECIIKYCTATFLTRWYWKRKMDEAEKDYDSALASYNYWHKNCNT